MRGRLGLVALALLACLVPLVTAGRAEAWHSAGWPFPERCHPIGGFGAPGGGATATELHLYAMREEQALSCIDRHLHGADTVARLNDLRDSLAPRTAPTLYARLDELEGKSDVLATKLDTVAAKLATGHEHDVTTHGKLDRLHDDLVALTAAVKAQTQAQNPGSTDDSPAYVRLASSEPLSAQLAQRQDDLIYALGLGLGLIATALPGYGLYRLVMPRA